MCLHRYLTYVGEHEQRNPEKKLYLYNCSKCKSTISFEIVKPPRINHILCSRFCKPKPEVLQRPLLRNLKKLQQTLIHEKSKNAESIETFKTDGDLIERERIDVFPD